MKIIALDQSTQVTGYAMYDDGTLTDFGVIDLHKDKDAHVRSAKMGMQIELKIRELSPDFVVAEEVSLQNPNVKTIVELARLQGMIIHATVSMRLPSPVFYTPSSWRKEVGIQTGRGIKREELKKAAKELVAQKYGFKVSDDIADAILIGQCAVARAVELKENNHVQECNYF